MDEKKTPHFEAKAKQLRNSESNEHSNKKFRNREK